MTTQSRNTLETQIINDFAQQFSTQIYTALLDAATDTSLIVPGGGVMGNLPATSNNKMLAVIKVKDAEDVWVALNEPAVAPTTDSFILTGSELVNSDIGLGRQVKTGDILHFYTDAASVVVSVAFYGIPG